MNLALVFLPLLLAIRTFFPYPTYREGVVGQPQSFHPFGAESDIDKTISRLLFRSLFQPRQDGSFAPDLAESYTISDDNRVYTVKLKNDQYWHDGVKITADDVLFTSAQLKSLREISTDKIDDLTVRFQLPNEYSPFISLLTEPLAPQHRSERINPLNPTGSGDFLVYKIRRDRGVIASITLGTDNSDYFYRLLTFRFYETEADTIRAYDLGEIDTLMATTADPPYAAEVESIPFYGRYYVVLFNRQSPFLEDAATRQTLTQAVDYPALYQEVLGGRQTPAQGPLDQTFAARDDLTGPSFVADQETLSGKVKVVAPCGETTEAVGEFLKSAWEKLGLTIDYQVHCLDVIQQRIIPERDYDILFVGQEVGRDPDRYVFWHSTQIQHPGLNLAQFSNLRVDRALEEGRKITDIEERATHYRIFQTALLENYPAIFLYHPTVGFYHRSNVSPDGLEDLFFPWERFGKLANWKRR